MHAETQREKKTKRLDLRISESLLNAILKASTESQIKLSDYIRNSLEKSIEIN